MTSVRTVLREYLATVGQPKPSHGRPNGFVPHRDERLRLVEERLQSPELSALERLDLVQRRITLQAATGQRNGEHADALEAAFVEVAAAYGEQRGISYAAWRAVGVPAAVLKRASISP